MRTSNRRDDQRLLATTGGILVVGTRTPHCTDAHLGGRPTRPPLPLVIRLVEGPRTRLADIKIDGALLGWPTHNSHPMIKTFSTHDSQLLHSAATAG